MRILLDQGIFDMRNLGQNALLQAAIDRVKKLWPDASIGVTTFAPQLLNLFFPGVTPVSPDGSHSWFKAGSRDNRIRGMVPAPILRVMLEVREELWYRLPGFRPRSALAKIKTWFQPASKSHETHEKALDSAVENTDAGTPDYASVVSGSDLFVATGSQYMCDHARDTAFQVLNRLEAAIQQGIPTAMVGQGMGPMDDVELRARAKEVLPLVDLILIRERLEAPALLASLGVDPARVFMTGDDAIELAYNARTSSLGSGIGVSMRCMPSTKVSNIDIPLIRKVLREAAQKYNVELVGLPISRSIHERDDLYTRQLLDGYSKVWMSRKKFETPLAYIKNIQRCRLMVAATFHGALLALAQGIPAICLVRSSLYANKFNGLTDLFGAGCEVIALEDEYFQEKLFSSIDSKWSSAEELKIQLLESAAWQIECGKSAYQQLFEFVEQKRRNT